MITVRKMLKSAQGPENLAPLTKVNFFLKKTLKTFQSLVCISQSHLLQNRFDNPLVLKNPQALKINPTFKKQSHMFSIPNSLLPLLIKLTIMVTLSENSPWDLLTHLKTSHIYHFGSPCFFRITLVAKKWNPPWKTNRCSIFPILWKRYSFQSKNRDGYQRSDISCTGWKSTFSFTFDAFSFPLITPTTLQFNSKNVIQNFFSILGLENLVLLNTL